MIRVFFDKKGAHIRATVRSGPPPHGALLGTITMNGLEFLELGPALADFVPEGEELLDPAPKPGSWESIPPNLRPGITRWIEEGFVPGDFLQAVIKNDLRDAFGRADETSRAALFDIVSWFHCHAPSPCWGGAESMRDWAHLHANGKRSKMPNGTVVLDVTDHEQTDGACAEDDS